MSKDTYHQLIRDLLEDDGWVITDDPLYVTTKLTTIEIDLGAEKLIGAEKEGNKIAVEIKSFVGHSKLHDLYKALGQYVFYMPVLQRHEPERLLFLALPLTAYNYFFSDPVAQEIVDSNKLKLLVFDTNAKKNSFMDKITKYDEIAKSVIQEIYANYAKSTRNVGFLLSVDEVRRHYLLISNGWQGSNRVYGILIHIEIAENGLVWVHEDNTDLIVVDWLLERSILAKDMVIGWHAPFMRADTEFAVV